METKISQEFAQRLVDAERTDEVQGIYDELLKQNDVEKVVLGQKGNNESAVSSQATDAMAAFTELPINSQDAIFRLLNEKNNLEAEDMSVLEFADEYEERIEPHNVDIIATGSPPTDDDVLNIAVRDTGAGQPPERFEDTFVDLQEPGLDKRQFNFMQGQFGAGSTAVLNYCGTSGRRKADEFKFIATSGYEKPGKWSWTLVTRDNDDRYNFVYLRDGDGPLTFEADEFCDIGHGSFVKLYHYRTNISNTNHVAPGKIHPGTSPFRRELERHLIRFPVGMNLIEKRYPDESSEVESLSSNGLINQIEKRAREAGSLKKREQVTQDFEHPELPERSIEVFLFKQKDEIPDGHSNDPIRIASGKSQQKHVVLFEVNGQKHASKGQYFLKTKCNLPKVASDTLVVVDCNDFSDSSMGAIFDSNRDGFRNTVIVEDLLEGVKDALQNDVECLVEEERRRRQNIPDVDDEQRQAIEQYLRNNSSIFSEGISGESSPSSTSSQSDSIEQRKKEFEPEDTPTRIDVIESFNSYTDFSLFEPDEDEEVFTIECPVNRTVKQRFETDVDDGYFSERGGTVEVTGDYDKRVNPSLGILSIRFQPPSYVDPGETIPVEVAIDGPEQESKVQTIIKIECTEPIENDSSQTTTDTSDEPAIPQVNVLEESEWEFGEDNAVHIEPSKTRKVGDLGIHINKGCQMYKEFIQKKNVKESRKSDVLRRFVLKIITGIVREYEYLVDEQEEMLENAERLPSEIVQGMINSHVEAMLETLYSEEQFQRITE